MTIKVGINGFGRMGRLAFRAAWDWPELEIVHINEIKGGAETAAHLLEFDSVHGTWDRSPIAGADGITIDGAPVSYSSHDHPKDIPWADYGVDIVIESSGKFLAPDVLTPHLDNGARKVVVAAPVKTGGVLNIVMGVNDHLYDGHQDIVTAASCTTNCLAPVVKVIHENFEIQHGSITTVHNVTNTQVMVDAPHKDLRRARSGMMSLIPTTTGSATSISLIYPELAGKLNGHAIRVPLLNASITDCVFEVGKATNPEEINARFRDASESSLKGVLAIEDRPLVSQDYVNNPHSSIVDAPSTMVVDGTHVKIYAWYDNEWGYVNRMMELAKNVAASL